MILLLSCDIDGIRTVILRGPLNPSTLVSCEHARSQDHLKLKATPYTLFSGTYIDYRTQLLSHIRHVRQYITRERVLPAIIYSETGTNKVTPVGQTTDNIEQNHNSDIFEKMSKPYMDRNDNVAVP